MTEREIFLALLDLPDAAARTDCLDRVCGDDTARRTRIESLLVSHDTAGTFLGSPALNLPDSDGSVTHTFSSEKPPEESNDDEALGFLAEPLRPDSFGRIGHYEVLEVLGRGGFGIVFRAFDDTLQRVVAVKVLAPQLAATSPARKRFLREARSSAKVRHENIVQVYAVEEQPLPYLVMEFIPGETLQQRLDRLGPLEVKEVVQLGLQIAEGLAAAHSTGLIHRDIKPGNILIENGPHHSIKITDFGLARAADDASLTQSGMVAGTPLFMAPEQARGETLDHRADLFSLGSVLYTMCSGRPPFRAKGTLAVLKRVAEDTPRPIQEIIPEVPQWLCNIIARLHAKKPEDRFATAREVADLLGRCLAEMQRPANVANFPHIPLPELAKKPPIQDKPKTEPVIGPRSPNRRWVVAAAVVLGLFGALGFTEATGVTNVRGTVIRLFSPEGTLVVEVDDPEVSVKIDGSEIVITGAGTKEIRLKPGNCKVEATKDGKVVSQELITVIKNGKQVVRVSQEAPTETRVADEGKKAPPVVEGKQTSPSTDADVKRIAALPPADRVEEVRKELKKRNPEFDGQLAPTIEGDAVTGLEFSTDRVKDISPVRVLTQLRFLNCSGSDVDQGEPKGQVSDLSPLKGLPLTSLACRYTPVSGLSALKDMKLTSLDLRHTNVSDADAKILAGLKTLQTLSLWGTKVTDAGLKNLAGLKDLSYLTLESTQVTDVGLKELAGLQSLATLSLYNDGGVTDAGLNELAGLKALRYLDLRGTKATDEGVIKLAAALPSLRIEGNGGAIEPKVNLDPDRKAAEYVLSLGGTIKVNGDQDIKAAHDLPREAFELSGVSLHSNQQATDAGLANFNGCKNLTYLSLWSTPVSDAGLANFKDCKNLKYLDLAYAQVNDAGLARFKDCKDLEHIGVEGNQQITDAVLVHFKNCKNLTHLP